jgi:Ca-activated chloride channel family protein
MAILSPSFGDVKKEITISEKEIFFLVDVSRSMSVKDVQPNRLIKTKQTLISTIKGINADKVGLIIFAKDAYVQCPLTNDKEAIQMFVETVNEDLLMEKGTDYSVAISLAIDKLVQTKTKESTAKIIVLFSDGEDFSQNTETSISLAKRKHIPIYTVGIGTEKGEKIPFNKGYALDEDGNYVLSTLQKKQLKNIARQTGGKYYEINDHFNDGDRLLRDIDLLKGIVTDTKMINVTADKYFYFIFIALVLIIFDVLVTFKTIKL